MYKKKPNAHNGNIFRTTIYLAAVIPLVMASQALGGEYYMGGLAVNLNTQLSIGSSWRAEKQDPSWISDTLNGNGNNGNVNFKEGDAFSQVFKGSNELQVSYENYGAFVRAKYWYDAVLENDDNLDDSMYHDLAKFSGAEIFDAFIYGEFEILDMPLDVRLGKQVVSWGESTFIRGGINAINPVDVSAFRRPGAEIKEGLLPVNMAYANIGLTDNLSMETFYQLEFQETVIEGCGTFFSTNDYAAEGCNSVSIAGGAFSVARDEDGLRKAKDDGQFGMAFRYVSEALGDTEFGIYAMNIHSRAPVAVGNTTDTTQAEIGAIANAAVMAAMGAGASLDDAKAFAGLQVVKTTAATANYAIAYPEDQVISGISFATNVGSVALSGEVSHSMDIPVQINGVDSTRTLLGLSTSSTELTALSQQADIDVDGFRLFDISQAQVTAIKFFDQVAGANRIAVVGEVGYSYIHSFDESNDAIKFGRSDVYGESLGTSADDGFTTESSWGYRLRVMGEYSDVFGGVNLKPTIAWSDDVKGYSNPGGNFNEGQQSLGLSVQATYLETYNARIAYTQYMGGDYSVISDRDFASMSIGLQF